MVLEDFRSHETRREEEILACNTIDEILAKYLSQVQLNFGGMNFTLDASTLATSELSNELKLATAATGSRSKSDSFAFEIVENIGIAH